MIPKRLLPALWGLVAWTLGVAIPSVALADGVLPGDGWNQPKDVSAHGHRIDSLITVTNFAITFLFIVMVIWMVWSVFAHNEKHTAVYDHGDSKKQIAVTLAIAGGIFLTVDGNLFYNSTVDLGEIFWNYEKPLSDPQHVKVEINARQWIWQARYTGPDGSFNTQDDPLVTNDIRIPVDTPVIAQLGSPDVIHNLYIPNLRVKIDVVPGSINQVWFQATEVGKYEIACAQHCGQAHYKMRAVLTVMPRDEYDRWAATASRDSAQIYDAKDTEANWGWAWKTKS
jgi:cytochrome c oxidase subunit 2